MSVLRHYLAQNKVRDLADLMPPNPVPAPPAPAQPNDVVSMVSAVVESLNIPDMFEKCSKGSGDSDADSGEDGADRLARLTSFGSQELRKESRSKSLSEMRLQSELTRLRNTQNDRKVKTKCGWIGLAPSHSQGSTFTFLTPSSGIVHGPDSNWHGLVGVQIATRLVTATLGARSPGGQQMVLTTSMFDGSGGMASAITVATANRIHAWALAWSSWARGGLVVWPRG